MRIVFRLWIVWAALWVIVLGFGDGLDAANMKALALLIGGPLVVILIGRWVIMPRGAQS